MFDEGGIEQTPSSLERYLVSNNDLTHFLSHPCMLHVQYCGIVVFVCSISGPTGLVGGTGVTGVQGATGEVHYGSFICIANYGI